MEKNLPANAGDMGSIPAPGRSHITAEQLSPSSTAIEPVPWSLEATTTEAHACSARREPTSVRSPHSTVKNHRSPQLEKSPRSNRDPEPSTVKYIMKNEYFKKRVDLKHKNTNLPSNV